MAEVAVGADHRVGVVVVSVAAEEVLEVAVILAEGVLAVAGNCEREIGADLITSRETDG